MALKAALKGCLEMQVLTPLQEARSLLEAHPGNPDPWLISGPSPTPIPSPFSVSYAWLLEDNFPQSGILVGGQSSQKHLVSLQKGFHLRALSSGGLTACTNDFGVALVMGIDRTILGKT